MTLAFGINITDAPYNAVGNGIADDTDAILSAIHAVELSGRSKKIFFPAADYLFSMPIKPTVPIQFIGEGAGLNRPVVNMAATKGTRLLWNGAYGKAVIELNSLGWGGGFEDIELDCRGQAWCAVAINGTCGHHFTRFRAGDFLDFGLLMLGSLGVCGWNHFEMTSWESVYPGNRCIGLHGTPGAGNACHNSFIQTRIEHAVGNRHGIVLGGCDNNAFYMTKMNGIGSTGYGVLVDPTEIPQLPNENFFSLLQTGNAWYQPSNTTWKPALIVGLHQSFQPITNGTPLSWITGDGAMHGMSLQ